MKPLMRKLPMVGLLARNGTALAISSALRASIQLLAAASTALRAILDRAAQSEIGRPVISEKQAAIFLVRRQTTPCRARAFRYLLRILAARYSETCRIRSRILPSAPRRTILSMQACHRRTSPPHSHHQAYRPSTVLLTAVIQAPSRLRSIWGQILLASSIWQAVLTLMPARG